MAGELFQAHAQEMGALMFFLSIHNVLQEKIYTSRSRRGKFSTEPAAAALQASRQEPRDYRRAAITIARLSSRSQQDDEGAGAKGAGFLAGKGLADEIMAAFG